MHISRMAVLVAVLVIASNAASAQVLGSVTGVIRDPSGAVLPGVLVEAASSALIERVRSVVSDGSGQYRIVDLRPGTYALTFTLTGFSTVKREGIELTGSFTATVNVEMTVGSVNETITVTGESPIVDVQGTTQQRVIDKEIVDAIPAGRSHQQLAVLIPGVTGAPPDVGGANTLGLVALAIHGSRATDMRVTANGVNLRNIGSPGQLISLQPAMAATQEITVDFGAGSAEQHSAGLQINYVPREGGNNLTGTFFGTYVGPSFQSSNYSDELRAAGLSQPNSLKRLYDFDGAVGGPIKRESLWFFVGGRRQTNESYLAGMYYNLNAGDPTKWTYAPDLTQQAFTPTTQSSVNARFTWQATPRNKFSFFAETQPRHWGTGTSTQSPEAASFFEYPKNRLLVAGWTSTVSNRLLLEASVADHSEILYNVVPPDGTIYRPEGEIWSTLIPVLEQSTGILYHGGGIAQGPAFLFSRQEGPNLYMTKASMSYVTGAHAFKVGFNNLSGHNRNSNQTVASATSYRFNNAIPNLITEYATPNSRRSHLTEGGVFVQDKWTHQRITASAGLRFDYFYTFFPEQVLGPGPLVPNRNITFAPTDWYQWKDLSPRLALVYDMFGSGKTALKASIGKYVLAVDPTLGNPYFNLANVVTRSWNDENRDYVPQCDLLNPMLNSECGTISDLRFGGLLPSTTTDPDTLSGWSKRPGNWEFSASAQHELLPRVGLNFGYFHRWFTNFTVTQNRAATPADYDHFSIVAPPDSRLPGGGGYTVGGLYDLNPTKVGQVDNFVTFAENLGGQMEHFDAFDFSVNVRPRQRLLLQGGFSTGRTSTDTCGIVSQYRNSVTVNSSIGTVQSVDMCQLHTPFLTQFKFLGTYGIPKIDVDVAATLQSLPGPVIAANYTASNAEVQPSLGRPLSGGAANVTANIVAPGTMYGERATSLDLRFSKVLRFSQLRSAVNFDLYNLFNSNAVLSLNSAYARWQVPLSILNARLFKISVQLDL
jgi:hypothetical protein